MELNGIANIKVIVTEAFHNGQIDQPTMEKIDEQLDTLERYMIAIAETLAINNLKYSYPWWHDVRDNKKAYPNNRERRG